MGKPKSKPPVTWHDWLLRPWTLDPRSLAAMRIGIALVLLWDLGNRVVHLTQMYTDDGVVTVETARAFYSFPWGYSPFFWSGEAWWAATVFGVMFAASLALLAGCYTRWVTPLLWMLVGSLHARIPLVNSGGDELLRMLLLWGSFSAWGDTWSYDAFRAREDFRGHEPRLNFGTAGIVFQLAVMYGMTALFKMNGDWYRGEPLLIAMRTEQWGTPLGEMLQAFPWLVLLMSWATLVIEGAAPFMLLSPWFSTPLRMVAAFLFIGLHIGIELTLDVGQFSAVCIAGWLAILPAAAWEWGPGKSIAIWMDRWTGTIPPEESAEAERAAPEPREPSPWDRAGQIVSGVFCVGCMAFIVLYQLSNVPAVEWYAYDPDRTEEELIRGKAISANPMLGAMPPWLRPIGKSLGIDQMWAMFAKAPRMTFWFVVEGRQKNGELVDLLRGGAPVDLSLKPANSATPFPNHRWQKMFRSLMTPSGSKFSADVAAYYLRTANRERSGEKALTRVRLIEVHEKAGIEKTTEVMEYGSHPFATAPESTGGAFSQQLELEGP